MPNEESILLRPVRPSVNKFQMGLLQIVHLETNDADAELVRAELHNGGIECDLHRVRSEAAFVEEITRLPADIILAEYHCPGGERGSALTIARERRPDVPFIFVSQSDDSGQVGESLGAGATDFIRKEHLPRLVPSIRRVIQEAHTQRDLQKVRQELLQHAELLDLANDAIVISDACRKNLLLESRRRAECGWARRRRPAGMCTLLQTGPPKKLAAVIRDIAEKAALGKEIRQLAVTVRRLSLRPAGRSGTGARCPLLQLSIKVTDRIRAQEALRRSEERYRRFVDEDLTGNLIMKPDGSIVTCNPAFVQIFGFDSIEEAQASNFLSLLHTKKEGVELLAGLRPNESTERHEIEMRQRDGDSVYVVARFVGSFDATGQLIELKGYLFNDSRRKRLEQQLIQAQKMEGLGTLAGGIAHDFNNILAIILSYATRLEDWKKHPEQMPEAIKVVRDAVARGASLVQQLLTSARQTEARFTALDLNALVHELEKMLAATFPKTINFVPAGTESTAGQGGRADPPGPAPSGTPGAIPPTTITTLSPESPLAMSCGNVSAV
jgi:PAS domain S-box-containing protein